MNKVEEKKRTKSLLIGYSAFHVLHEFFLESHIVQHMPHAVQCKHITTSESQFINEQFNSLHVLYDVRQSHAKKPHSKHEIAPQNFQGSLLPFCRLVRKQLKYLGNSYRVKMSLKKQRFQRRPFPRPFPLLLG